jgi:hypothetical protein
MGTAYELLEDNNGSMAHKQQDQSYDQEHADPVCFPDEFQFPSPPLLDGLSITIQINQSQYKDYLADKQATEDHEKL